MPILNNYYSDGRSWKENGISREQIIRKWRGINDGSEALWEFALGIINQA